MSDKTRQKSDDFFAIPGVSILALSGRDTVAFAQAQFMNDVSTLAPGHWQWNGWLTPKGRVIALFALLRTGDESLLLALLDADAEGFAARLQRYVFRSKVGITARPDLHATGRLAPPARATRARFDDTGDGIELDAGSATHPRTLRIGAPGADDATGALEWLRLDLAHGLPRLPPAQSEQWTPQQLSLDRLKAYSVRKGCYPGQEIVARTHFLGQAKRGLARLSGGGLAPTARVVAGADGREIGEVVCAAAGEGLAVMPLDAGSGPFLVAGSPATPLPLLDGLAR